MKLFRNNIAQRCFTFLLLFFYTAILSVPAVAESALISTGYFSDIAVGGYDPVAYFLESKPTKGEKQFSYKYKNATWYFSKKENLEAFQKNPEQFAPQYGGYCAYAIARGDLVGSDPEAWKIVDGKLYLNYSKSIKKTWEEKQSSYIVEGDKQWVTLSNK